MSDMTSGMAKTVVSTENQHADARESVREIRPEQAAEVPLQPDHKAIHGAAGRVLIRVSPDRIGWAFGRRSWRAKAAFIKDSAFLPALLRRGSWDRRVFPFAEHEAYELFAELIRSDFDTVAGEAALRRYYVRRGQPDPAAKTARKLDDYLARYGAIARDMAVHGYRPFMTRDEIGVALGRDGRVIKVSGGNHRLALAQLLGLSEVVAEIRFAHVARYRHRPRHKAGGAAAMIREDARALDLQPID